MDSVAWKRGAYASQLASGFQSDLPLFAVDKTLKYGCGHAAGLGDRVQGLSGSREGGLELPRQRDVTGSLPPSQNSSMLMGPTYIGELSSSAFEGCPANSARASRILAASSAVNFRLRRMRSTMIPSAVVTAPFRKRLQDRQPADLLDDIEDDGQVLPRAALPQR